MTRHVNFYVSSKYATKIQCHFGRVKNVHDAPKITLKYSSIFRRRVKNVDDALSYIYSLEAFQLAL